MNNYHVPAQPDHAPDHDALARLPACLCSNGVAERTAHIGSWAIDLSDHRLSYSAEFAAILGVTADTPITLEMMAAKYTPEWRASINAFIHNCGLSGTAFDEEMQIEATAKTRKWVRTVGEAVYGQNEESGQIVRIQGALQDISDQKQAHRQTLRLAMRLTTTLASITEAFVTLDRQCCFTYLNSESERLLQRTTGELLGKEAWQDYGNGVEQRLKQQLEKSLETNCRVEFEDYYPTLDKWLDVRAYPFAEGLAVYFRDVTERRKSQAQLMLLETSISRLNDIVVIAEASPADESEPLIVFVNDAFELHTGYGRDEVLGQTPRMLLGPDPQIGRLHRMSVALKQNKQVRNELMIYKKDGSWFWVELEIVVVLGQLGELTHWVAVGRDITQRKAAEEKIHHLAFYDSLTELPTRQVLLDRLQHLLAQSARTRRQGALLFIDVDHFKVVNDTLGHDKGDLLLQKVAARLSDCVRKTDTVARLGGDEFVVMLEDLGDEPDATKAGNVAEKILSHLREPFDLDGHQYYMTSSVGVALLNGQQDSVSELLKQADLAMYQAKTLGRNTVCFFDPDMQASVSAKAVISSDLRVALRDQQFLVYYQPQVDRHDHVTGVEALLRWQHPAWGLIAPADFIPVAEESGLILPLGQWVLETACEQLVVWAERPETADLNIAVNVSVRQFRHPDFVDMVMATIKRSGIRPHRLKLELTESLLADRMEITIAKLGTLKALGVTLSLDDFGMGYSSLSVLKRLPLDQLKIDGSFVADLLTDRNDAAISRAIIALARTLSLEVVAEGVETQDQRNILIELGCHQFQGYLFSRPLPIEQLESYFLGLR
ncbi:PAS domain S-box-containing protein/diguanylate cyclase (GGDEF) domain-containing protein [Polaromonas sp. OV174]|uniref:sensor domain-containing protein n=1 Tax=Polaromonas sp. OV174 TaxID=1855300 RepID=UPI0008EED796|nr:EAL domain-containing protein [Polaromonas sp. OV174]SFC24111.1 PAS domain S-box-containing protein/diguanylate cyclase (GGDEF) domain-containing protein [Polaromonas sp. OV174]